MRNNFGYEKDDGASEQVARRDKTAREKHRSRDVFPVFKLRRKTTKVI